MFTICVYICSYMIFPQGQMLFLINFNALFTFFDFGLNFTIRNRIPLGSVTGIVVLS